MSIFPVSEGPTSYGRQVQSAGLLVFLKHSSPSWKDPHTHVAISWWIQPFGRLHWSSTATINASDLCASPLYGVRIVEFIPFRNAKKPSVNTDRKILLSYLIFHIGGEHGLKLQPVFVVALVTTVVSPEMGLYAVSNLASYVPPGGVLVFSFGNVFEIILALQHSCLRLALFDYFYLL